MLWQVVYCASFFLLFSQAVSAVWRRLLSTRIQYFFLGVTKSIIYLQSLTANLPHITARRGLPMHV